MGNFYSKIKGGIKVYTLEELKEIKNLYKSNAGDVTPIEEKFGVIPFDILNQILKCNTDIDIEEELDNLDSIGVSEHVFYTLRLTSELLEVHQCNSCGNYFSAKADHIWYNEEFYCKDCVDTYFYTCIECGGYVHEDDVILDENDDAYCDVCARSVLYRCDRCGTYHTANDIVTDSEGYHLCTNCYDNYFAICENCGRFVYTDDIYRGGGGECYCEDCYNSIEEVINDYYYKPSPIFHGVGPRYLGVELEVDGEGEDLDNAQEVIDILGEKHVYCKHDGSLNNGFEIVSHPATLEYHQNNINWEDALEKLKDMGYLSHDAKTCGIHVHMSRNGFGDTEEEQDKGIAQVLYFFERHWDKIVKFSRRTRQQLDDWAARYLSDEPDYPDNVLEYAKNDSSRYRCVNLLNTDTVEVRVFRGSLIYETFIATLQFCQLMYEVSDMSLQDVMDLTWNQFKEMGSKYAEFSNYIKKRKL